MKVKLTKTLLIFAAVIVLSGSMVAYASSTLLLTQTFPTQSFTSPISGCNSLVTYSINNTIEGAPTLIIYGCPSNYPAFEIGGSSSQLFELTPTFTVPSGWNLDLSFNALCNTYALTSGTPVYLQGATEYFYCLTSSSASNITSTWTISWSLS